METFLLPSRMTLWTKNLLLVLAVFLFSLAEKNESNSS